jgi:low affinity Fe/Cu permease
LILSSAQFATSSQHVAGVLSSNVLDAEERRMNKPPVEPKDRTVHDHFGRFAAFASGWLGSTWAFVGAGLVIGMWAATGPIFHFSNKWAEVIGTGTALLTFLMVFLIQNTQNRNARAINLKLNELIRAMDSARNHMIDIERLTDLELDEMQATYERIKAISIARRPGKAPEPPVK